MAYIGAEPVPGQNREVDDISSGFNGNATAFTLQVSSVNVSPESANNILINLGGVLQNPGTDYTIAASTITFTTAPAAGLSFFGLILGAGINTATVADDTIGSSKLIDTAVTAGSYTTADITVDAQGRITAAASGSISNAEIANNAVTTAKIADSTGASDGVTTAKLATDAVTAAKLASNSVVSDSIVDGSIVNADVNASAAIAGTKISPDFGSQTVITDGVSLIGLSSTLSSNTAKLQVANTDGNADIIVHRAGNNANPPSLNFQKTRNASIGNYSTIVQDDDELGSIRWGGADGSNIGFAARIVGAVDGTPGANDMPGRIQFHTSADGSEGLTERMRIDSSGNVGIGTTSPPTGCVHVHLTETPEFNLFSTQHSQNNNCKINFGVGQSASVSGNTGARIEMNIPNSGGAMTGELKFFTNSGDNLQERMRIDSSGKVAIGETSPDQRLSIASPAGQDSYFETNTLVNGGLLINVSGTQRGVFANDSAFSGTTTDIGIGAKGNMLFRAGTSSYTERMRIQSDGNIAIGKTSNLGNGATPGFELHSVSHYSMFVRAGGIPMYVGRNSTTGIIVSYLYNGTQRGTISTDGTVIALTGTSDYRLKENNITISDGIARLKQLKPYRFNFKETPSKTIDGFFAHEVDLVVPEAVFGDKDAVATEEDVQSGISVGDIKPQQLDQSKLVPLLVAAVQELITKVETLEAA